MNIATIAMLVAVIILFGGACFVKNKSLNFLLQAFGFVALLGFGAVVGNSQNNFSGYVVFLLVSVAPQFLNLFDMQSYIQSKQEKTDLIKPEEAKNAEENDSEKTDDENISENLADEKPETEEENREASQKKLKKKPFLTSKGDFLGGIANLLSAVCVTFAGLYLGLETFYGAAFGVATGFALMFLYLALKEEINKFDLFGATLSFVAIGLLLGSIVTVILYSMSLTNLLFCAGALLMATSFGFKAAHKIRFGNLLYCIGMICLFATLLF